MAPDDRDILDTLARTAPAPPGVHWGRYRAELREKLETRRQRRGCAVLYADVTLALSAGLAGVLLFFAVWGGYRNGTGTDFTALEETVLGGRLGLLQQYAVVERLDLLEELDVIRNLDRLAAGRQG